MPDALEPMIRLRGVRVDYDNLTAVRDLDLEIGAGEVFGLIGPNGAGKTSTIRVLAGLQEPTYGRVEIAGIDLARHPRGAVAVLGYMPDMPPVHPDLKCWEFLDLFAAAHGIGRAERHRRVEQALVDVGLTEKRNVRSGTLSRGMQQRLVLAKTLLHEPKVLLLDEPASGLDPLARIQLRDLLKRLARERRTVLISSHILAEMSGFCTSVGIMEAGRLVLSGSIEAITRKMARGRRVVVELLDQIDLAASRVAAMPGAVAVHRVDGRLEIDFDGDDARTAQLLRDLVTQNLPVRAFYEQRMDIEGILLRTGAKEVS